MINKNELEILSSAVETLAKGSEHLPEFTPEFDVAKVAEVIEAAATRMQDNYPYFHPQYAGQMLKPPHAVARIAYALSLWVNPNNHALDGSRASSPMEKECIVELGAMYGWEQHLGHLTGGGTMANLEALWVAGQLHPGKRIVGSSQAHYTHSRISQVLQIPYSPIDSDTDGRLSVDALRAELAKGDVGTVVATMGNTGLGAVDPLTDILALQDEFDFRVHCDAAYGGYFGLTSILGDPAKAHFDAMTRADSIVVDPHKHGLQPYGCGCVLFRDPDVGRIYKHDSPYTYFSSEELHLGEISLECSRAGASAVALWATHQLLPPQPGGEFAKSLDACLDAARDFHRRLDESPSYEPLMPPELDIVVYAVAANDSKSASEKAQAIFDIAAEKELHLALMEVPAQIVEKWAKEMDVNTETITCLRSVLMKPEQLEWTERLVALLEECAAEVN